MTSFGVASGVAVDDKSPESSSSSPLTGVECSVMSFLKIETALAEEGEESGEGGGVRGVGSGGANPEGFRRRTRGHTCVSGVLRLNRTCLRELLCQLAHASSRGRTAL